MRMLRWMSGPSKKDMIRNKYISGSDSHCGQHEEGKTKIVQKSDGKT